MSVTGPPRQDFPMPNSNERHEHTGGAPSCSSVSSSVAPSRRLSLISDSSSSEEGEYSFSPFRGAQTVGGERWSCGETSELQEVNRIKVQRENAVQESFGKLLSQRPRQFDFKTVLEGCQERLKKARQKGKDTRVKRLERRIQNLELLQNLVSNTVNKVVIRDIWGWGENATIKAESEIGISEYDTFILEDLERATGKLVIQLDSSYQSQLENISLLREEALGKGPVKQDDWDWVGRTAKYKKDSHNNAFIREATLLYDTIYNDEEEIIYNIHDMKLVPPMRRTNPLFGYQNEDQELCDGFSDYLPTSPDLRGEDLYMHSEQERAEPVMRRERLVDQAPLIDSAPSTPRRSMLSRQPSQYLTEEEQEEGEEEPSLPPLNPSLSFPSPPPPPPPPPLPPSSPSSLTIIPATAQTKEIDQPPLPSRLSGTGSPIRQSLLEVSVPSGFSAVKQKMKTSSGSLNAIVKMIPDEVFNDSVACKVNISNSQGEALTAYKFMHDGKVQYLAEWDYDVLSNIILPELEKRLEQSDELGTFIDQVNQILMGNTFEPCHYTLLLQAVLIIVKESDPEKDIRYSEMEGKPQLDLVKRTKKTHVSKVDKHAKKKLKENLRLLSPLGNFGKTDKVRYGGMFCGLRPHTEDNGAVLGGSCSAESQETIKVVLQSIGKTSKEPVLDLVRLQKERDRRGAVCGFGRREEVDIILAMTSQERLTEFIDRMEAEKRMLPAELEYLRAIRINSNNVASIKTTAKEQFLNKTVRINENEPTTYGWLICNKCFEGNTDAPEFKAALQGVGLEEGLGHAVLEDVESDL